jgi:hypothetical protein
MASSSDCAASCFVLGDNNEEKLRRCFMVSCFERGVVEDSTRNGVYWCADHAQRQAYCFLCGRSPLCEVGRDGGVQVPWHAHCRKIMYDKMISTEVQEILGELRKHCPELLTQSFCTNDCQACLQYIKTRTRIREDLQQQLLESSIAAMHSEYEQRDNWICERCEAVRSVEWYDDTMYLCRTCASELEDTPQESLYCICTQCGKACQPAEKSHAHLFGDDIGAVCVACMAAAFAVNSADTDAFCSSCFLYKASASWIEDLSIFLCIECQQAQVL